MASEWAGDVFLWLESRGIALTHRQRKKLAIFVREVLTWQKKMNLVGVSTRDRLIRELLLDSLVLLPYLAKDGKLLDLGSGAGFPAIPLKICLPNVHFQLLEPRIRKAVFLRHAVRLLQLDRIEVTAGRIEESGESLPLHGYQIITARAVTSLHQTLQWCAPYLARKGVLISFQGYAWREALEASLDSMKRLELVVSRTLPYRLPGKSGERVILFFSRKDAHHDQPTGKSGPL